MHSELPTGQETQYLLEEIRTGNKSALGQLLTRHRDLVRRMIELRLDAELRGRVDASDVVQEAQMEIARRIDDYLERRPMPFHLWMRQTAYQNLLRLRRQHVSAKCRSVVNEVMLPGDSSVLLAQQVLGKSCPPDQQVLEQEMVQLVHEALSELPEMDREIILMRTFEGLDNHQVAQVLELDAKTASKRYGRALLKMRKRLSLDAGDSES